MFRSKNLCFGLVLLALVWGINTVQAESLIDVQSYRALTSDHRAYRVGEPIVILVIESTRAESTANTGVQSNVAISGTYGDDDNNHSAGVALSGKNDGSGQTSRKGQATTQLSTRVTEIIGAGLFRIEGEHNLIVNGEHQQIILSGIIRAEDITKDNSVLSNRIADAHVKIVGSGDVSDSQHQSILYKVFKWLRLM